MRADDEAFLWILARRRSEVGERGANMTDLLVGVGGGWMARVRSGEGVRLPVREVVSKYINEDNCGKVQQR